MYKMYRMYKILAIWYSEAITLFDIYRHFNITVTDTGIDNVNNTKYRILKYIIQLVTGAENHLSWRVFLIGTKSFEVYCCLRNRNWVYQFWVDLCILQLYP